MKERIKELLNDENVHIKKLQYLTKYTEIESNLVILLEDYADKLNRIIDGLVVSIDYVVMMDDIDKIEDMDLPEGNVKPYAEYLRGAALPFYDKEIEMSDYEVNDELVSVEIHDKPDYDEKLESNKTWVRMLKENPNIHKMENKVSGKLEEYYNKSKYKWALMIGVHHCFKGLEREGRLLKYKE